MLTLPCVTHPGPAVGTGWLDIRADLCNTMREITRVSAYPQGNKHDNNLLKVTL